MLQANTIEVASAEWRAEPLRVSPSVRLLSMQEREVLFSEGMQRLFELNPTASLIWRGAASGLSSAEISAHLAKDSADPRNVAQFVDDAVAEWLSLGFLVPEGVASELSSPSATSLSLRISDFNAELRIFGNADAAEIEAVFSALSSSAASRSDAMISIVGMGDHDFLVEGSDPVGMVRRHETVPRIKALLTEGLCKSVASGFLTHGALVSRNGKSVLISGPPGAGKTTLTLALCVNGFAYGGDDIVRISEDGRAAGVPFAAAAKTGSWPLLRDYVPGLEALIVHERTDKQLTRYVVPSDIDRSGPRPIDVVLSLAREPGAEARIEPTSALEAFCMLIESGYSEHSQLSGELAQALSRALSKANCGRLVYDDLPSALSLLKTLTE